MVKGRDRVNMVIRLVILGPGADKKAQTLEDLLKKAGFVLNEDRRWRKKKLPLRRARICGKRKATK